MAKTVMYIAAIATLSILLISVLAFDVEAKTFTTNGPVFMKGDFADFGQVATGDVNKIRVTISEIKDSKDVSIDYKVRNVSGVLIAYGEDCISSKQIIKIVALKSASIKFDTADLACSDKDGTSGVISAELQIREDGEKEKKNQTNKTDCNKSGDLCWRVWGYTQIVSAVGEATAFGVSIEVRGDFSKVNEKKIYWNP